MRPGPRQVRPRLAQSEECTAAFVCRAARPVTEHRSARAGERGGWSLTSYEYMYSRVGASCVGRPIRVCAVLAPLRRVYI